MNRVCLKCGVQIENSDIKFCPNCGNSLEKKLNSGMLNAAKILMIISCVAVGWTLIPLAWMIPMTIKIANREKSGEKLSVGFKVCTLLFANFISGILLLCDEEI